LGATDGGATRTDATNKAFRIGAAHYTNAQTPYAIIMGASSVTENEIRIGGGTGLLNAATSIGFYTTGSTTSPQLSHVWKIYGTGIFESNGAQTIRTSTGNLTLATAAGNGHIVLSPHGTGYVGIGTASPSQKLDVSNGYINLTGNYGLRWNNGDSEIRGVSGYHLTFSTYTGAALTEKVRIQSNGNTGIGTTTPNARLSVNGGTNITGSLDVTGDFTAQTKSFKIQHQAQPDKSLVYGVLEGPEHAVYARGRLTNKISIVLPPEWDWLIDPSSITVQLTPIGSHQKLYVESIINGVVFIQNENLLNKNIDCYYIVHATRRDVEPLQTVQ
jgi:hypothetical protein